jgi:hypothetical protein
MAVIAATNPTLMDVIKVTEPDGGVITDVVEMLSKMTPFVEDGTWMEANGGSYHRTSIRTGIPLPTWRMYYQGVLPSKGTYAQVDEPIGMMEARAQVDQKLVEINTNPAAFRFLESKGHIEGMKQQMEETALYGAVTTSPQKFNGLIPRYASLAAASGENIIDAGGTGSDNASILLVRWSPQTVHFIYPRGSQAGIKRTDLGLNHHANPPDGSSGEFSAYEEKFEQDAGLVVRDWRAAVRIANIDVSDVIAKVNAPAILEYMAAAVDKLPDVGAADSRTVFYMPRFMRTMLRIQTMNQKNVMVSVGQEEGRAKLRFDDFEIKVLDALLSTESRVT